MALTSTEKKEIEVLIVVKVFREFYNFMWTQRGYWEPRLKNA